LGLTRRPSGAIFDIGPHAVNLEGNASKLSAYSVNSLWSKAGCVQVALNKADFRGARDLVARKGFEGCGCGAWVYCFKSYANALLAFKESGTGDGHFF